MYQSDFLTISPGRTIFVQNDPVQAVYQLVHGEVRLWQNGQDVGRLTSGHILGLDGAYAPSCVHPYTAQAETECRLAAFTLDQVPEALIASPLMADKVFYSLSRQLHQGWERLSAHPSRQPPPSYVGQVITASSGEAIIREGEMGDNVYRIVSTEQGLEVSSQGSILSLLDRPGEFFGEMAAVLDQPRTATIRSRGQSVLEVYPAHLLSSMIVDYPELGWRIIHGLSQRLHQANARLKSE
ncbi:MAG: cyclic nucleotide-binding domain-containing protein [Desulfovermiculus sp.]|nr:cyclic nucleotide-binding domain-containing protein [Desulfovermiculus sp.]